MHFVWQLSTFWDMVQEHGAASTFCDVRFVMPMADLTVVLDSDAAEGTDIGTFGTAGQQLIPVGPFTWWTLDFNDPINVNYDFSKVTGITMQFIGKSTPTNRR